MNHIRGLFRPTPIVRVGTHASAAPLHDSSGGGAGGGDDEGSAGRKSRTSAKPRRRHNNESRGSAENGSRGNNGDSGGRGDRQGGSAASSVASSTALDHLYEDYCDNITADELKSRSGERRPCMVVREFNDDYIAPSASHRAVFLPREYNIVGDDEVEGEALSGYDDLSDMLSRTQGTATTTTTTTTALTTLLSKNDSPAGSPAILGGPRSGSHAGSPTTSSDAALAVQNPFTTSQVLALHSDKTAAEFTSDGSAMKKQHRPSGGKSKLARNARQATPQEQTSKLCATAQADESGNSSNDSRRPTSGQGDVATSESSQVRRYSVSSWSFLEEEAKIHGQVRRVVVPPATDATNDDGAGNAATLNCPAEVEVVRLNEAHFTQSELARWRHYQAARMNSFMGTSNDSATPSVSTPSRDAPSSNSASGPEFMPMLGAANLASETSGQGWDDVELEGDAHMGAPIPAERLVRVCCSREEGAERRSTNVARRTALSSPLLPQATAASQPAGTLASTSPVFTTTTTTTTMAPPPPPPPTAIAPHPPQARGGHPRDAIIAPHDSASGSSSSHSSGSCTSSPSSGSSGSDSVSDSGDDDEDDHTFSVDASSVSSVSADGSPGITSFDAAIATESASTTSDAVQLPDIGSNSNKKHRASSRGVAAGHVKASDELHPLPPVARPHGLPAFRRRVHR